MEGFGISGVREAFDHLGASPGDPVQEPERGDMRAVHGSGHFAFLGEAENELAHFGFAHLCGRAHEILGKVPDAVQISSGGVRAVAFE